MFFAHLDKTNNLLEFQVEKALRTKYIVARRNRVDSEIFCLYRKESISKRILPNIFLLSSIQSLAKKTGLCSFRECSRSYYPVP